MLNCKFILPLTVITTLSLSTSALAFQAVSKHADTRASIIYVNNSSLKDDAHKFISNLMEQGIGVLENKDMPEEKRQKKFSALLHNNFDMKTIARFSLGRYWRTSTKSEQKEYLKLFEDMIVEVYSRRFSNYDGQKIEVTSAREEGRADIMVSSIIIPETGSKIDVDWRVRKKKDGQLKVIDIIVEGVSMSMTQRSDFSSVIQRGGGKIEVLLAHLRPKD